MSKPAPGSLKDALAAVIDSPEGLAALQDLVREALQAKKKKNVDMEFECKHCKKRQRPRVWIDIPDWAAREKFLALAISYVHGKAPTADKPKPKPKVTGSFDDMTDEELEALLGGETDSSAAEEAA